MLFGCSGNSKLCLPNEGWQEEPGQKVVPASPEGKTTQQQQTGRERKLRHTRRSEDRVRMSEQLLVGHCDGQAASERRRKGKKKGRKRKKRVAGPFGTDRRGVAEEAQSGARMCAMGGGGVDMFCAVWW